MKKNAFLVILLSVLVCHIQASIVFSSLDLNSKNLILFSAQSTDQWHPEYKALFSASADTGKTNILTCFPENMEILHNGKTLQIRNWFGSARFTADGGTLKWTTQSSIFDSATPIAYNPPAELSVSPDGNWTLYLRKTGSATAELMLIDEVNGIKTSIAEDVVFRSNSIPVRWSPDSSVFVYEKDGKLLFAVPEMFFGKTRIDDKYRTLSSGTINCVYWPSAEQLVIAKGKDLYSIPRNELYTRSLYSEITGTGKKIGQLPVAFNGSTDFFWLNETAQAVLFIQNKSNVWMYDLSTSNSGQKAFVIPFVNLPEQVTDVKAFYTADGLPVIWVERLIQGGKNSLAFRMRSVTQPSGKIQYSINSIEIPSGAYDPALSPDRTKISFNSDEGICIYDAANWEVLDKFSGEKINKYLWADDENLFIGGFETIRSWNISTKVQHVLVLSSAENFAWSDNGQDILAEACGKVFNYNKTSGLWRLSSETMQRSRSVQNNQLRVYLDSSKNGYYKNAIYVRSTNEKSYTRTLLKEPDGNAPGAWTQNRPKVALCFEALDNADGITQILTALAKKNTRATFFINGEFMARFPNAVQEIAAAGHQCGSMFFTNADFLNSSYNITEDFISGGLARNEDNFFELTGQDLSLIWHMPHYISNAVIKAAGEKAGYTCVNEDIAPPDWITIEDTTSIPKGYKTSPEMIEWISTKLRNGAVISINTGLSGGKRNDYLYEYIEEIVTMLISSGYDVVPYSELY
ncbi:MAG: polysaccharide deacetylase family protein [Spirochaetaceae bacterium]|nr:polysaccharide deacetylase family protein [Spirochaetaceae bacterium]